MLQGGDHALLIAKGGVALESTHGRDAHPRNQIWVFAVSFFDTAPARIACHIHYGRQRLVRAAQPRFPSGHGEERLGQIGIERGAQSDWLRKACGIDGGVAMQALLVKNHGDSKTSVLEKESLNGVGEFRHAAGFLALSRIAGAADLAESASVLKSRLGFLKIEAALGVHERFGLLLPDAHHLCGLLFQGHSGQEVFNPFGSGQSGIAIRRIFARGRWFCRHGWLAAHAEFVVDSNYNEIAARNQAAEVDDE